MASNLSRDLQLLLLESFGKANYAESFPQVFGPGTTAKHFILREKNTLAAFCASIPFHWCVGGRRVTGHCIGSVCSAEKFRGQGFASKVITLAEIDAKNCGASFTFLFSELDVFYQKLGYQPYGKELFAPLAASPAFNQTATQNLAALAEIGQKTSASLRYRFTRPGETIAAEHAKALWALISHFSHSSENILAFSEFQRLLAIPRVEIHTLWDTTTPVAVFFVGKGADFENVAHSVSACSPELLGKLFSCHFEKFPGSSLLLMLPPGAQTLSQLLTTTETPAYFAKILSQTPAEHLALELLLAGERLYPRTFQSI